MIAIHTHIFCDLYAKQEFPSVLLNCRTPETFWWYQNIAWGEKSTEHSKELMKQVLVMVSKKVTTNIKSMVCPVTKPLMWTISFLPA